LASSNGDQRIATEKHDERIATGKSSDQMIVTWVIVGAVVVAIAVAVAVLLRNRPGRPDPLSGLVVDALGADWADRTGANVDTVRSAALRGQPAQVRSHLASLVEDVEVGFEFDGAGPTRVSVQCRYTDGTSATTATMDVPWEKIPQEVRAQFLRSGDKTVSRHWSVS
jgi:hypothetical protein